MMEILVFNPFHEQCCKMTKHTLKKIFKACLAILQHYA